MTTTIKVHVNGDYKTTVYQQNKGSDTRTATVIDAVGVNGGKEQSFYLPHPAAATFEISEEYCPRSKPAE